MYKRIIMDKKVKILLSIFLILILVSFAWFKFFYRSNNKVASVNEQMGGQTNETVSDQRQTNNYTREGIGPSFFKKNGEVFFYYRENDFKVEGADADSFQILNDSFAKDKNHIFFKYFILTGVDEATFQILDYGYSKDKNQVFFNEKALPNVNAQTFVVLSVSFAKDNNKIYYHGEPTIVDINSYEIVSDEIGASYIKDKNNVYFDNELMLYADPSSFQVLTDGYSKDKNRVYISGRTMLDSLLDGEYTVDAQTFVVLGDGFTKDKNYVFRYAKILAGVNPDGFDINSYLKNN